MCLNLCSILSCTYKSKILFIGTWLIPLWQKWIAVWNLQFFFNFICLFIFIHPLISRFSSSLFDGFFFFGYKFNIYGIVNYFFFQNCYLNSVKNNNKLFLEIKHLLLGFFQRRDLLVLWKTMISFVHSHGKIRLILWIFM